MARRHWLDPLARRLLIASGQIKPPAAGAGGASSAMAGSGAAEAGGAAASASAAAAEVLHNDAVERDLLALRLAQNPALALRNATEVRHAAALGWSLDVNRATAADWGRLPGCGREQVDLLLRLQKGGVQLSGPEDLRAVLELDAALLASWLPLLRFRWYGEPPAPAGPVPVAVNRASARDLGVLPELTAERCARLLRERARGSFRDLADLRDRLGLPPAVVEQWIARVSFEPGRPGPDLPLGAPSVANPGGGPASPPGPAAPSPAAPEPPAPGPFAPGSTTSGPTTPGPSAPGPFAPRPTTPGPPAPGPTTLGPSAPGPFAPGSTTSGPTTPGPFAPRPTTLGPTTPGPFAPRPTTPGPPAPGPSAPGSSTPGPPAPGPSGPGSSTPGPSAPGSSAPGPTTARPPAAKGGAGPSLPPGRRDASRRLR